MDEGHYKNIFDEHMRSVVLNNDADSDLIPVCFPTREAVFAPPACAWSVKINANLFKSKILATEKNLHNLISSLFANSVVLISVQHLLNVLFAACS
jgi:hypothetical protein